MGFKKLGLFFFVIILFQIQLHPLHTHPLQNTSTATTGTSPSHPFLLYYIFRFLQFHQFKARSLIVLLAFYSLQLSRRGVAFILHPCKQLLLFFSFFPSFFLQKKTGTQLGLQGIVSVDRRGGGGGGHGGGGHASHSTGSRAHGGRINGDEGYKHGSTVVPLYVAGAMSHHQNNHQRHGSNEASPNHAGSSYLVLTALAVSLLTFFAQLTIAASSCVCMCIIMSKILQSRLDFDVWFVCLPPAMDF